MTAPPYSQTLVLAIERFRAGEFRQAGELAHEALEAAGRISADELASAAESLLFDFRLQPIFASRQRAAESVPFFRWLARAVHHGLGDEHLATAFARTRLASALAVAGDDEQAAASLSASLASIPIAVLDIEPEEGARLVPRRGPAVEQPESAQLCSHLQPILEAARDDGATIAAAFETRGAEHCYWVYLDNIILDTDALRDRLALPLSIIEHTELYTGPRPCHGFRCTEHMSALLGLHPGLAGKSRILA